MLGTALDDHGADKKDEKGKEVFFCEGKPLPDWRTSYDVLEAKGVWEKSVMRLFQRAARENDVNKFRQLIKESNVNPNLRDKKGWTAILRAAKCGQVDVVDWLITAKADINTVNNEGSSALMKAAKYFHLGVVNSLVQNSAHTNMANEGGASALMLAAQTDKDNGVVKALLEHKANIHYSKPDVNYTALMMAARYGNSAAVSEMVMAGAHLEDKDVQGETALSKALKYENKETAAILSGAGAEPVTVTVVKRPSHLEKDSARMGKDYRSARDTRGSSRDSRGGRESRSTSRDGRSQSPSRSSSTSKRNSTQSGQRKSGLSTPRKHPMDSARHHSSHMS